MRVPHTIPKLTLKAYTRKLNPEELQKSYEGRSLRAEDPSWDEKLTHSLKDTCLSQVIENYIFYVKYVEELNTQKREDHETSKEQWQAALANYVERKYSYERKLKELEQYDMGQDPTTVDDDDDDDEENVVAGAGPKPPKKVLEPPEKVPSTFNEFESLKPLLDQLWDDDRMQAIAELDLDYVPFEMAVLTIPDDYYWERMCNKKWTVWMRRPSYSELSVLLYIFQFLLDCDDHGRKWRRMFLERTIWEAIEAFHPVDGDLEDLQDLIDLVSNEVIEIRVNNLIPNCYGSPSKPAEGKLLEADFQAGGEEEDHGFGDVDEDEQELKKLATAKEIERDVQAKKEKKLIYQIRQSQEKEVAEGKPKVVTPPPVAALEADAEATAAVESTPEPETPPELIEGDRSTSDHIDFSLFLPKFCYLKVLSLVYEMQETGLDWEQRFFIFTDVDCINLANAIARTPSIETFELLRSHVNDEQVKTLVREGLMKMPHLKKVNLSYNRIRDAGARAVARLLSDESARAVHTIHTVSLARNQIHNRGAKALAWALTKNRHLTHLDLRCNKIGDNAGKDFGYALVKNKSLLALQLSANRLGESTAYVMNKMLCHNTTIRELDLSSNDLTTKGGELLAKGIKRNGNILRLDLRLANVSLDFQLDIYNRLRKNRNRAAHQYSYSERDDILPNEVESGVLVDVEKELPEPNWSDEENEREKGEDEEDEEDEEWAEEDDGEEELQVVKPPGELEISKTVL